MTQNNKREAWVAAMMARMSPRQRIAQLLHVPAWSNRDATHQSALLELVERYGIGGIIFFQGTARKQAEMTNHLQAAAQVPLFISIDGEWGLAMRLEEMLRFPYAVTLGAIEDDELIFQCGKAIGEQCRRLGIHINYAPVVDVNTEPDNPVIGFRAFGVKPERVAQKAIAFMRGQQAAGVMAVAKHFPGHGDTSVDSHLALPTVTHDLTRFREWEWYPYREAIAAGVEGVMVAHLAVPALEKAHLPASLSATIVQQYLQQELGFDGLVFTDALNMKGAKSYRPGAGDAQAVLAGHDVLLYVEDVPLAIEHIQAAVEAGEITQTEIDRRVSKQLHAKYKAGLSHVSPIRLDTIVEELNPSKNEKLVQRLFDEAVRLVFDKNNMLPILDWETTAFVVFSPVKNHFWKKKFPRAHFFYVFDSSDVELWDNLPQKLDTFDRTICIVHGLSQKATLNFGLDDQLAEDIRTIVLQKPTLLILPSNPYVFPKLQLQQVAAILIAYEDRPTSWESIAKVLLGEINATDGWEGDFFP